MKKIRKISLFALFLSLLILPSYSFAQLIKIDSTAGRLGAIGEVACAIYYCVANNGLFSIIATMAIFFLGIGAFFGRLMWGTVFVTTLGIVIIVGASNIATTLVGTANKCQWAFGDDVCPVSFGPNCNGLGGVIQQCEFDCEDFISQDYIDLVGDIRAAEDYERCYYSCIAAGGC